MHVLYIVGMKKAKALFPKTKNYKILKRKLKKGVEKWL